jgi:hypothetical protein
MKRRFHLPFEGAPDSDDSSAPGEDDGPDLEIVAPKALILAAAAAVGQLIWPLPLPLVLLFAVLGVGQSVAWLVGEGRLGTAAFLIFVFLTPNNLGLRFLLGATSIFLAATGTTLGIGLLIRRARGDH